MQRLVVPNSFPRRRSKGQAGFTLIEVTVALFLLAAIVLIFSGSVIVADRASHLNGQYAQAISLGQHKIDQMRAVGYGRVWDTLSDCPNFEELNDAGIIDDTPTTSEFSFKTVDDVAQYLPNATAKVKVEKVLISVTVGGTAYQVPAVKSTVTLKWNPKAHTPANESKLVLTGLLTNVE